MTKEKKDSKSGLKQRKQSTDHKQKEEALRKSEERFHKNFDYSNDGKIITNPSDNFKILDANPSACRMLGFSHEELLSLSASAIHPHEMPKFLAFGESVYEKGKGWTDELSCKTSKGNYLSVEISASLIDIDGKTCMIGMIRDISKRKEAK